MKVVSLFCKEDTIIQELEVESVMIYVCRNLLLEEARESTVIITNFLIFIRAFTKIKSVQVCIHVHFFLELFLESFNSSL
jgi:hypothetical protein